jgi:hypothetical protein
LRWNIVLSKRITRQRQRSHTKATTAGHQGGSKSEPGMDTTEARGEGQVMCEIMKWNGPICELKGQELHVWE